MSTIKEAMKRFVSDSQFTMEEENSEVIIARPFDPTIQEEMLREARLAGVADKQTTIDGLYDIFRAEGFHEEIVEEASRRWPQFVRKHQKGR